jgi:hypothetical protein
MPVVPETKEKVLIISGSAIISVSTRLAVVLFASVTWTVKLDVPAVVGVPEITPVEAARLNPAGRLPVVINHVYGVWPPVAVSVWLYVVPVMPENNDEVVIVIGDVIVMLNGRVTVVVFASVTCTVKFDVPAVVGIPAILPVKLSKASPAGKLPEVIDQV